MVSHGRIAVRSSDPRGTFRLLATAAALIGDVQIRHRGTLGGSLCARRPGGRLPARCSLTARRSCWSRQGERAVPAREFFVDVMFTDLRPDELLVEVQVPSCPGAGSAYVRFARVEGSFAIVNAAAVVDGGRPVIAIGGAAGAPVLVEPDVDVGGGLTDEALEEIGDAAYEASEDAYGDLNASADYRREMARVFARRAVEAALGRRDRPDLTKRRQMQIPISVTVNGRTHALESTPG